MSMNGKHDVARQGSASQRGFTLIELIMVIVIMGVIGGMVSVFMKSPIDAYIASGRRAAITDTADTTVRRIGRDLRKSLPNSLLLPGSSCMEFIPTKTGGRYREAGDSTATVAQTALNILDFTAEDHSFNMLGDNSVLPADQQIQQGDLIAVYNLGIPGASAYQRDNIARVSAATTPILAHVSAGITYGPETLITTDARLAAYPLESGGKRFHVISAAEHVVSYVCVGATVARAGTLFRYARPALTAAYTTPASCAALQLTMLADLTNPPAVLAQNVSTCSFVYDPANQRDAIVQITLGLTLSGEAVNLYHEVHVDNTP
jgi:MSHA biogenesis protein MshO